MRNSTVFVGTKLFWNPFW